jgi:hypothetical protein
LKSRKGALKKKEKLVKSEVERFQGSLAQLNAIGAAKQTPVQDMDVERQEQLGTGDHQQKDVPTQNSTGSRWAVLRGFISATMEQNPAFVAKKEDEK